MINLEHVRHLSLDRTGSSDGPNGQISIVATTEDGVGAARCRVARLAYYSEAEADTLSEAAMRVITHICLQWGNPAGSRRPVDVLELWQRAIDALKKNEEGNVNAD